MGTLLRYLTALAVGAVAGKNYNKIKEGAQKVKKKVKEFADEIKEEIEKEKKKK